MSNFICMVFGCAQRGEVVRTVFLCEPYFCSAAPLLVVLFKSPLDQPSGLPRGLFYASVVKETLVGNKKVVFAFQPLISCSQ